MHSPEAWDAAPVARRGGGPTPVTLRATPPRAGDRRRPLGACGGFSYCGVYSAGVSAMSSATRGVKRPFPLALLSPACGGAECNEAGVWPPPRAPQARIPCLRGPPRPCPAAVRWRKGAVRITDSADWKDSTDRNE